MPTKIDFKRELRNLYLHGRAPGVVDVPEMAFLMVDGEGDPNTTPAYTEAIEALFAVAYAAKFMVKRMRPGADFAVMPLESLWWSDGMSTLGLEDKSVRAEGAVPQNDAHGEQVPDAAAPLHEVRSSAMRV